MRADFPRAAFPRLRLHGAAALLYYAIPAQVTKSRNTNSFAEVDILDDGSAAITGYFLAQSWKKQIADKAI